MSAFRITSRHDPGIILFAVFLQIVSVMACAAAVTDGASYNPMPPNLDEYIEIQGDIFTGVTGTQHITTDSFGYRTTIPVQYHRKPAGTLRIGAIGASTTAQPLLDDHNTWTHLLQVRLQKNLKNRIEVINAGVPGMPLAAQLEAAQRLSNHAPDILLLLPGTNDRIRQIRNRFGRLISQNTAPAATVPAQPVPPRQATQVNPHKTRIERGDWIARQNDALNRRHVIHSFRPDEVDAGFSQHLQSILALCKTKQIVCIVLTQPSAYDPVVSDGLRQRLWMTPPNESYSLDFDSLVWMSRLYNHHLLNVAHRAASPYIQACDIAPLLPPTEATFYDDVHFNVHGAERMSVVVANCVLNVLQNKTLIPTARTLRNPTVHSNP